MIPKIWPGNAVNGTLFHVEQLRTGIYTRVDLGFEKVVDAYYT